MDPHFQQYRFARIEGQNITRARLEARFGNGIADAGAFEREIEEQLKQESSAPWRNSEVEQTGFREGARLAALEFYWSHREEVRRLILLAGKGREDAYLGDNKDTDV